MKCINHIRTIAALTAVVLFSCQRPAEEEFLPDGEPEQVRLLFSGEMPALCDSIASADAKTFWNGETILWSKGDRIALCLTAEGVWNEEYYVSDPLEELAMLAEFPVDVPSSLSGSLQFHAIYPSSALKEGRLQLPNVALEIPAVQTPEESSFDPAADLMTGRAVETYAGVPDESVPLLWTRLVAHADITLASLTTEESEKIRSVTLKAQDGAALAGVFELDLSAQTLTPTSAVSEITLDAGGLSQTQKGSLSVWASLAPCTLTSLKVTVTTDKALYVRNVSSCSLPLMQNARNILTIDMSSAERKMLPEEEEKLNALVNSRVFDLLDLEATGMSQVKELYNQGEFYKAAEALKEYWRTSRTVVNPNVDLSLTTYSAVQKNRADQALKENGYRFYVKNYAEKGKDDDSDAQYYSFADGSGGINWSFTLSGETQFEIQKHRHQWALPQAKVWWGTKDDIYVRSYMEVYSSWLAAHPCPGASTGNYEIAASHALRDMWTDLQATSRVMDQIDILDYYINSESFTPEFLTHFLTAYADAVECIRANPYHEELSNHRLYEIQAVFTAGMMMPEFKAASSWLAEASSDMGEQLKIQFADDGVLVEMDPGYHIPMVAIFYDSHKLASTNNRQDVLPENWNSYLENAVKFVRDLCYPDYSIEDFNDVRSSSWNKSTLTKNFRKYAELFPNDPTLEYWASGFTSGTAPTEMLSEYKTTGWYILRNGWTKNSTMLVMKNNYNVKADGGVWWHCQPDNGTVSLYHKDRHFLPDAGAYTYTNGADRDAFRATKMHNTLTSNLVTIADSRMQGTYVGSKVDKDCMMVHVKNQSYGNLRHERVVFMVDQIYYVIVDAALGSFKNTSVEVSWHLCPGDVSFDTYGSNAYGCHTSFADGNNMMFKTFCFSGTKGIVPAEGFTPSTGTSYTSSEINEKTERKFYRTAVSVGSTNAPVRFITVIYPVSDYSSAPDISATFGSTANTVVVTINGKDRTLTY